MLHRILLCQVQYTAPWKAPGWLRQFAQPLRFDERGQPSAAALAKLAGAQRVRQGFQVGDAVDVEFLQLGVGRKQMQRALSHPPHAERFAQLEVIDAEQFQALLRSEERRVGKECRSRWSP